MSLPKTVILGGGLAGLRAASQLNGQALLYEQQADLGGLCRQVTANGFRFDVVPHVLHFQHEAIRSWVTRLLDGRLTRYERRAGVYAHGTYIRYPFQAHLFGLPSAVVTECIQDRVAASRNGAPDPSTFERWIFSTFGTGIARHFMVPYNTKFWTVPPSELTCEWLDGLVPVPTVEQTIRGASESDPSEYGYNTVFWYPRAGGLGAIVKALLRRAGALRLGKRLVRMETPAHRLHFADGDTVDYDVLLSSIPLPELSDFLDPLPEEIAHALGGLRWTSICVVHLGISGSPPVPWHWVYAPDRDVRFYRVGIPSHYAPDAAPEGHYILSAEIAHAPGQPIDPQAVTATAIRDLIRLGLLRREQDIVVRVPIDLRYGYPIYDRNYAWTTTLIQRYLRNCGIIPMGRFGSWRYLSMEQALMDGQRAAHMISDLAEHDALLR